MRNINQQHRDFREMVQLDIQILINSMGHPIIINYSGQMDILIFQEIIDFLYLFFNCAISYSNIYPIFSPKIFYLHILRNYNFLAIFIQLQNHNFMNLWFHVFKITIYVADGLMLNLQFNLIKIIFMKNFLFLLIFYSNNYVIKA